MTSSLKIRLREPYNRKILLIFVVIVLDAVATVWLMCQGFGEANPIMAWVAEVWSIAGLGIVKIIWSLSLLMLVMRWEIFQKYVDYLIIGYFILYAGGWLVQFVWEAIRWTQ